VSERGRPPGEPLNVVFPEDTMTEPSQDGTAVPASADPRPRKQRDLKLLFVGLGFAAALVLLIALNMN
jgi:hypothetical protein